MPDMVNIHPSALVHPKAQLGIGVSVGAFTIIGEHVTISDGTSIGSHCVIEGHTSIGRDNKIHHYAALGGVPQDKKYNGEPTRLEIGDRNTIREFVSFNVGTAQDKGVTSIGSDNWVMGYVHIAHDCRVGNQTILASNAQLAGHCEVGLGDSRWAYRIPSICPYWCARHDRRRFHARSGCAAFRYGAGLSNHPSGH